MAVPASLDLGAAELSRGPGDTAAVCFTRVGAIRVVLGGFLCTFWQSVGLLLRVPAWEPSDMIAIEQLHDDHRPVWTLSKTEKPSLSWSSRVGEKERFAVLLCLGDALCLLVHVLVVRHAAIHDRLSYELAYSASGLRLATGMRVTAR
jgi:hypothetical protein